MIINTLNSLNRYFLWISAGAATGILLGWWQWVSIKHLSKENSNLIINRLYIILALRVIIVSGISLAAFFQGFPFGLSFLASFLISRWVWVYFTINKNKNYKE